jgi:hypothetical protein
MDVGARTARLIAEGVAPRGERLAQTAGQQVADACPPWSMLVALFTGGLALVRRTV